MRPKARKACPNCRRLQAKLDAQAAWLEALEATVARLQEQLAAARKDSSNYSKPPSSDIVKPPEPAPPEGRQGPRIGGQPGHPSMSEPPSRPRPSTAARSTIASTPAPSAGMACSRCSRSCPG
jgi:hypothetical protein